MGADSTAKSEEAQSLDNEALYNALAHKRRRYTLHHLKQCGDPVSVQDLAEQVAAWENDKSVAELDSQERKRVYIALYQSHLSTMDEEGLVEYDEDSGMVSLSDSMQSRELYLEVVPDRSVPWSIFYAGLTVANAVILLLAWQGVAPFDAVPDLVWAAVVLVTFGLSAFVQVFRTQDMRIGDAGPPPELRTSD